MSKRPFDHIENKIREAAEQSEPPFNEHAWEKMELLLDKDDKKRRFIFWWRLGLPLLFIGLCIGGYKLYTRNTNGSSLTEASQLKVPEQYDAAVIPGGDTRNATAKQADTIKAKQNFPPAAVVDKPQNSSTAAAEPLDKKKQVLTNQVTTSPENVERLSASKKSAVSGTSSSTVRSRLKPSAKRKLFAKGKAIVTTADISISEDQPLSMEQQKALDEQVYGSVNVQDTSNTDAKNDSLFVASLKRQQQTTDTNGKKTAPEAKTAGKKANAGKSKLYVIVQGGAEILKTRAFSYNNIQLSGRYGVAIGYELFNRLSIQAGFYAGRKEYTGGPGDYHPKQGTYLSMVNIKQVEASCLIYDIPISVRYDVKASKTGVKWYVAAGISSFIMKKEDYNYYYTYNSMPYTIHEKPYHYTGNKNLFSSLLFSAGFEKPILKNTSLLVEPFFSLPVKGVGEGTVKLYSTGLQLGIKYKPKF